MKSFALVLGVFTALFGFSNSAMAAPPKIPVVASVIPNTETGKLDIYGSNLATTIAPVVTGFYVDGGGFKSQPLAIDSFSASKITAVLPVGIVPGTHQVVVATGALVISNRFDFTISFPAQPVTIPASAINIKTAFKTAQLSVETLEATCDQGSTPLAGGYTSSKGATIVSSFPTANGWKVNFTNANVAESEELNVYVTCLTVSQP